MYNSINNIDKQLHQKYFKNTKNGKFIEAGANDGLLQSNTAFFEKQMGWTGVLIEPIHEVFLKCVKNRSKNTIILNKALDAEDNLRLEINYTPESHGLMSTICGINIEKEHLKKAGELGLKQIIFTIKLDTLINNYIPQKQKINLLSLDVEGYEPQALKGLKEEIGRIEFICIEQQYNSIEIDKMLVNTHKKVFQLSEHDYLWQKKQ